MTNPSTPGTPSSCSTTEGRLTATTPPTTAPSCTTPTPHVIPFPPLRPPLPPPSRLLPPPPALVHVEVAYTAGPYRGAPGRGFPGRVAHRDLRLTLHPRRHLHGRRLHGDGVEPFPFLRGPAPQEPLLVHGRFDRLLHFDGSHLD